MSTRRGKRCRSERSPLPLPRPARWRTIATVTGLLLLATLWLVGSPHPEWVAKWGWLPVRAVWGTLAQIFSGAARAFSVGGGAPLSIQLGCLALALFFLWALRRWLAHNTYKPGPVDAQPLVDATPAGQTNPRVADLTAQFRKHLSETELYPPTALPAEAPSENFLDLLGNAEPWSWKGLVNIFSRLRPKVAYRVSGVLQIRDIKPCFGVTVTVTSYATRASRMEAVWGSSWDEVVHMAGSWVVAAILPVTRSCKNPPWQDWQGRSLPYELFEAYQQGRMLSRQRRFDEALHNFYEAARLDPTNLHVRTQIGATQERLGLYLDALETYHGALATLGGLSTDEEDKRLWISPSIWQRLSYWWHWRHRPGVLDARYRRAVVLGTSEETAHQWCKHDESVHPRRAKTRKDIRDALRPALVDRYWPAVVEVAMRDPHFGSGHNWAKENVEELARSWLRDKLDTEETDTTATEATIRLVFQLACLQEMRRLTEDHSMLLNIFRRRPSKVGLTRSELRITSLVWAPMRLAWAFADYRKIHHPIVKRQQPGTAPGKAVARPRSGFKRRSASNEQQSWRRLGNAYVPWPASTEDYKVLHPPDRASWAPRPSELEKRIEEARTWYTRQHQREWQDHYNAACVYAVAMNAYQDRCACQFCDSALHDDLRKLPHLAVDELKNAVRSAESGYVTLQKAWLLNDDPDLTRLREVSGHFKRFEREVFPHSIFRDRVYDIRPIQIEMAAYDRQLLADIAKVMERTWRSRGASDSANVYDLAEWFEGEKAVWQCIQRVTGSLARNWPDREDLLQRVQQVADPAMLTWSGLRTTVPEYDNILGEDEWSDSKSARQEVKLFDERLAWLNSCVSTGSNNSSPIGSSSRQLDEVRKAAASGQTSLERHTVQRWCARYAAIWLQLRYLVLDPTDKHLADVTAFDDALRKLP